MRLELDLMMNPFRYRIGLNHKHAMSDLSDPSTPAHRFIGGGQRNHPTKSRRDDRKNREVNMRNQFLIQVYKSQVQKEENPRFTYCSILNEINLVLHFLEQRINS